MQMLEDLPNWVRMCLEITACLLIGLFFLWLDVKVFSKDIEGNKEIRGYQPNAPKGEIKAPQGGSGEVK